QGEHATQISTPNWKCHVFYDDDDEYSIQYREYLENSSNAITPNLPIEDPEVSLIMGNEELNTIPEKESDKFIKFSVEDLVLIPSESEDTSESDSECILPSCHDFSSINDFESKDSYDSNLDEPDLLVTPLFDVNEYECFDPRGNVDEINDFKDDYYDSEGNILYLESLLSDDTTPNLPQEVFLDRDPKSLSDEPNINDLMTEDKIFDLGIHDQNVFPTYVSQARDSHKNKRFSGGNPTAWNFEDSHARSFVHRPLELLSLAYGNPIS
nr:hypothetical protein [Tanacetum cinerariifolium]